MGSWRRRRSGAPSRGSGGRCINLLGMSSLQFVGKDNVADTTNQHPAIVFFSEEIQNLPVLDLDTRHIKECSRVRFFETDFPLKGMEALWSAATGTSLRRRAGQLLGRQIAQSGTPRGSRPYTVPQSRVHRLAANHGQARPHSRSSYTSTEIMRDYASVEGDIIVQRSFVINAWSSRVPCS
ncbi:hypothetical protein T484DRAFT_1754859 [Baffinella frigidus]|nr:hypothetical protein T484DRAFT_1754859 [Cryptophyta sp. CCMP2293]